jgi:uncharacterized protein YcbK (DUF882 family)
MALGFTKQYDTSIYDEQSFIEVWPEISEIGLEICEGVLEKMDDSTVIIPGATNQLISYIKGCVFMLGFSEVDEGTEVDHYDQYMSTAVLRSRSSMLDMGITIEIVDLIDKLYVKGLIEIFSIYDQTDISRLRSVLLKNKIKKDFPVKNDVSGVKKAETDPKASTPTTDSATTSTVKTKEVRPGVNFPVDASMASKSIQYSLASDGLKKLSDNFKVSDFRSKDGSDVILVNPELIKLLEKIRKHFGRPVSIVSGYRTPSYNSKLSGAAKNSQHMYGNAADIKIEGVSPKEIYNWLSDWHKGGLGVYPTFVHVDVRDTVGQRLARWGKGASSDVA